MFFIIIDNYCYKNLFKMNGWYLWINDDVVCNLDLGLSVLNMFVFMIFIVDLNYLCNVGYLCY